MHINPKMGVALSIYYSLFKSLFKGDKMKTLQKYDLDVFEVTIGALIGVLGLSMVVEMYVMIFA